MPGLLGGFDGVARSVRGWDLIRGGPDVRAPFLTTGLSDPIVSPVMLRGLRLGLADFDTAQAPYLPFAARSKLLRPRSLRTTTARALDGLLGAIVQAVVVARVRRLRAAPVSSLPLR